MRLPAALLLAILSGIGTSAAAQQANASVASPNRADIKAYRTLFRRDLLFNKLADEAHDPKPYLRRLLAHRFDLSEAERANLDRLSIAYQHEIDPIHARALVIIG